MSQYIRLFFAGLWSRSFWEARWETFLALLKPDKFYKNAGQKAWDRDAYLLGISASTVCFGLGCLKSLVLMNWSDGILTLVALPLGLICAFLGWLISLYLHYHIGSRIFAFAGKLILKKDVLNKVRPILFTLMVTEVAGVIPWLGGLLVLGLFIVLLVLAYESALKAERGQAIAMTLLGIVFTVVIVLVLYLIFGGIFLGIEMAILSGLSHSR